jgi:hypothetical protein
VSAELSKKPKLAADPLAAVEGVVTVPPQMLCERTSTTEEAPTVDLLQPRLEQMEAETPSGNPSQTPLKRVEEKTSHEPSAKKTKLSLAKEVDNERVETMLSDFVDT